MMKLAMATGLALALGAGVAAAQTTSPGTSGQTGAAGSAMQMTQAECQSLWSKIDTQNSGSVSQTQTQQYVKDFKAADANSDGRLSSTEFQNACQRGLVQSAAAGSGATGTGTGSGSGTTGSGSGTGSGSTGGTSR